MRDLHIPDRPRVFVTNGLCATSHPLAAKVAIDILQAGGNAADAAISAAVLLGICEPQMTGIGGDCFALVKPAGTEKVHALNGSGRAPKALDAEALRATGHTAIPIHGAEAVTVPGAIDAFCALSERFGVLGLDQVLAPTIRYADEGVPVAQRTAFDWANDAGTLQGVARDYYLFGGSAPNVGQVFRAPKQAEILRRVAKNGRAGFYEGAVAEDMVAGLKSVGGVHTLDDFFNTKATWHDPIEADYKGTTLIEHPPNGQGATAMLMAGILSHFDLPSMDPWGVARAHLEAEAAKLAYDARNRFVADLDYVTRLDHMLAPETAAGLAALIDPTQAMENPHALSETVHKETIYLTVVDKDRMVVSLIYSVFHGFGSGIASPEFGVLFQNRGAGFTLEKDHPNEAAGGKRPMHTIIPAMLKRDGQVCTSFGVMGGAYQPNGHARMLTNLVDFGLDPQSAISAPRSFADSDGLNVERGYKAGVRQGLADLGHTLVIPDTPIGGAQMIAIDHDNGVLEGASDPRKDGCALGY
ncbi:gamma-glutamyltransferase family protein [Qingshengfaniella alkalisoli]|uniref:Gamma-glutamyltransferase family protein n=1 Tax=Qingshengfaniella alkalisoli TaxID=2599296 RepID=A0A5B8IV55_9RHOB|nr:gamma-glutamyltransferase family protein [Qingshengfaniella alkalisoli]QDY68358.1 gamma-glutamyltransferase family protein [Qingshengfaniella alkalisoli]